jgi:FAD/FMN-containing dehydrogenase
MIATNTGGSRAVRYGDVRRSVLGLEAVLADGTVFNSLKSLRTDNTGPDLKQLFIASAGQFGIVTRAALELQRMPVTRAVALIVPASHAILPDVLQWLEQEYGELLLSFEGMSGNAIRLTCQRHGHLSRVFSDDGIPDYAVLVELASSSVFRSRGLAAALRQSLSALTQRGWLRGYHTRHPAEYWLLRDSIPQTLCGLPSVMTLDISMSRSCLVDFRQALVKMLEERYPKTTLADFGHFADGGDHVTVVGHQEQRGGSVSYLWLRLRSDIYDLVARYGGSFSAEHGIGPDNHSVYRKYVPESTRQLTSRVKQLLDPHERLGRTARKAS